MLRLHFQYQITVVSVDVVRGENTAVAVKPSISLVPAIRIEAIEIVPPMEFERFRIFVVSEHLHIVVEKVPRHINWFKTLPPCVVCGSPEVHSQRLSFFREVDGQRIVLIKVACLSAVNGERNVVGSPFHLVDVPFIVRVEMFLVFVLLLLLLAVSVYHVC